MRFAEMYVAVREEARAAVEGGFHMLVAPEHLRAEPYGMLQPWPLLAAVREAAPAPVATVASIIAGLSSAERIAAELATLRAIGDGPAGVALAAGYRPEDFAAARRPYAERYARRGEILHALADSGACDPGWLWSAAGTEQAARRAREAGVPMYGAPTLGVDEAVALGAAGGYGQVLRRDVLIGDDEAQARDYWERFGALKYGAYERWGFTEAADHAVIVGTPAQVADRLRAVVERTGALGLVLRLCWPEMTAAESLAHVRRFVTDVAPALGFAGVPAPQLALPIGAHA
jgi:alkanesulfonate monooxygenase SsuD/methylene tetrahydromethanopterin reductase-like flavin-dependent oxidoreductase (luciferase family)